MKKFYILITSIALLAGTAMAQQNGNAGAGAGTGSGTGGVMDGSADGQGPGPHGQGGSMELPDNAPADVVAARESLLALRAEREAYIAGLGDVTPEELHDALQEWRDAHADQIEEIKANAQLVRDYFRSQRPDRGGLGQTDGMQARRLQFREDIQTMRENQRQLRLQLQDPDLTEEERQALIQAFRDENRETMQKLRARKRQQRLEDDGVGGDRRQGPGS